MERDVSPREVDQAVELATERVETVQESFASEVDDGSVRPDLATTVNSRAEDLDVLAGEARERVEEPDDRPAQPRVPLQKKVVRARRRSAR